MFLRENVNVIEEVPSLGDMVGLSVLHIYFQVIETTRLCMVLVMSIDAKASSDAQWNVLCDRA
jgi:hypothetical protein